MNIKILRTISNQIIIGDVKIIGTTYNIYKINKPYYVMPTQQGLQFLPMDAEIIGAELPFAEISKENTIYCTTPGKSISDAYSRAVNAEGTPAIEQEEKQLIID